VRASARARDRRRRVEPARATAEIIARVLGGARLAVDERLIEARSQFDGFRKTAFLEPRHWHRLRNPLRPSWGEPFEDIERRMRAMIDDERSAHAGAAVVLVSHQSPIWIARRSIEAHGVPPWLAPMRCAPGSVTTLRFGANRFEGHIYWHP
jgi:broad specificity phosphatase PhoE